MKYMLRNTFLALLITNLIACASFEKNLIADVENMPNVSAFKNKPAVYIDFKFFHGKPLANPVETIQATNFFKPTIENAVSSSELFSSYTFDPFSQENADYTIKIYGYNYGNTGAAAASGFITGFTFGVIPGGATDNYTFSFEVFDGNGNNITQSQNSDAIKTWVGIWFIPLMGYTPAEASTNTIENQVRAGLKEIFESGKLKYSSIQHLHSTTNI